MAPAAIDTAASNNGQSPATAHVQTQVTLGGKIIASAFSIASIKEIH
jgi:hypothetical protein